MFAVCKLFYFPIPFQMEIYTHIIIAYVKIHKHILYLICEKFLPL